MENKGCIYFDGTGKGKGGLCDRLKGMYSSYNLALNLNKKFYYNIPYPVALDAKNYEILKNDNFEEINIIDSDNYRNYRGKILNLEFPSENYKIHTNINFADDFENKVSFNAFINNFFNLTKFEFEHNIFKFDIGVHIRYGGKTVDWIDSDFESKFDESAFKTKIDEICSDKNKEIYLCSDSKSVLKMADSLNIKNLYTSPNIPKHTDRSENVEEMDYVNSFIDLLTLANCDLIFSTKGEFAKTASKIYNKNIKDLF
jgi:hypothetical protein